MKKIHAKAIVFDYGNTIVHDPFLDVLKLKVSDFQKILERFGYKFRKNEIIKTWVKADRDVNYPHIAHFAQEITIIEETLKRLKLKKSDRLKLSEKLLRIYRVGYRKILKNNLKRKREIERTLKYLKKKGKKLAVFSDGRKLDARTALKLYGVTKYFDFILTSEEIGIEKPNPLVFRIISKKIGESAKNVVYIGDNPVDDIEGAKQIGMKAILYIPPKKYRRKVPWRRYNVKISFKPDATIKKFSDLTKVLI